MVEAFNTPTNSPTRNFNLSRDGIAGFAGNEPDSSDNEVIEFHDPVNSPNVNFNLTRDGIRGFNPR